MRRDGVAEDLQRNSPVYTGERIETGPTGRIELQLPGGELVRIEAGSVVDLYALGENPRREEEGTLVGLSQGPLQTDVPAGGEIRIDTPTASVYPNSRAALRVDIGTGNMVRISVERGTVEVAGEGGSVTLRSGERTRVYASGPPRKPAPYNLMVRDSFGSWVASRDDLYELRAAPGREYEELPEEVRPYYGELSRNGSWVYADEEGSYVVF